MTKLILLSCGVVALGLMACSSDEDGGGGGSSGTDGGAGSPGTGGTPGGTGGTPGGTGGGATGGSGGGATAGSGGAPGGSGGTPPAGDAGPSGGSGGGGTLPMDGSQNSFCQSTGDCNMGLACYEFGSYCSAECTMDTDCESLGANYTCFTMFGGGGGTGVCRVECMDASDTSCPEGMSCVDIAMGTFRCAYPMGSGGGADGGATGTTPVFDQCMGAGECAAGLQCTAFMGGNGFCTQANCMDDADCTDQPGSGSVMATCSGFGLCTLDCAMDMSGCPDGMECQTFGGGGFAFCNYP